MFCGPVSLISTFGFVAFPTFTNDMKSLGLKKGYNNEYTEYIAYNNVESSELAKPRQEIVVAKGRL